MFRALRCDGRGQCERNKRARKQCVSPGRFLSTVVYTDAPWLGGELGRVVLSIARAIEHHLAFDGVIICATFGVAISGSVAA